jgi:hypothetical protein
VGNLSGRESADVFRPRRKGHPDVGEFDARILAFEQLPNGDRLPVDGGRRLGEDEYSPSLGRPIGESPRRHRTPSTLPGKARAEDAVDLDLVAVVRRLTRVLGPALRLIGPART